MTIDFARINASSIHADWCEGNLYLSIANDTDRLVLFIGPENDATRAILAAIHSAVALPSIVPDLADIDAEAAEYMDAAEKGPKRIELNVPFRRKDGVEMVWKGEERRGLLKCWEPDDRDWWNYQKDGAWSGEVCDPSYSRHAEWYTGPAPTVCDACGVTHG